MKQSVLLGDQEPVLLIQSMIILYVRNASLTLMNLHETCYFVLNNQPLFSSHVNRTKWQIILSQRKMKINPLHEDPVQILGPYLFINEAK